jgi:hypothetical protein
MAVPVVCAAELVVNIRQSAEGVHCAGVSTKSDHCHLEPFDGAGYVDLMFPSLTLLHGCYVGSVTIFDIESRRPYHRRHRAFPFAVILDRRDGGLV